MGWLEPANVPPQCLCPDRPDSLGVQDGSRWQCDTCGRIYRMTSGSQYNEYWTNWQLERKA